MLENLTGVMKKSIESWIWQTEYGWSEFAILIFSLHLQYSWCTVYTEYKNIQYPIQKTHLAERLKERGKVCVSWITHLRVKYHQH